MPMYSIVHPTRCFSYIFVGLVSHCLLHSEHLPLAYRFAACALITNDEKTLCDVARWFMKEFQFVTDGYRLFSAVHRLCDGRDGWFNCGASQKFVLRQLKAMDSSQLSQSGHRNPDKGRTPSTTEDGENNPVDDTNMDLALLMLYGYILYLGRSFSLALSMLLPHLVDTIQLTCLRLFLPRVCLGPKQSDYQSLVGLSYIQHAIKRQSDDRHRLITQGLTFLLGYYDLRQSSRSASEKQEAAFNVGRTYHMLGLTHLAVPYYQRCLASSRNQPRNGAIHCDDFSLEAAFALQNIWATNADMGKAMDITHNYLVI